MGFTDVWGSSLTRQGHLKAKFPKMGGAVGSIGFEVRQAKGD
jgi:hypothetical protein